MDPALLTREAFWLDPTPALAGESATAGHVLFETSGSSGRPKQVAISKTALLVSAAAVNQHLSVTRESRWGLALPLHHVGGFGVAARAWQAGCPLSHFKIRWNAAAFQEWAVREGITHTSLVPTQVHDLVAAGLAAPSALRVAVVGGGQLDLQTGRAAQKLGWPVLASYGMTEAGSQIATQGLESLAKVYQPAPIPLLPIWQGRIAADGLLCISGTALFSGTVVEGKFFRREGEWHTTSDRAELAGLLLTPLGRGDTFVKVLGELVDPEAIERKLIEISDGGLAAGTFAIIAVPDARSQNVLVPVFDPTTDPTLIETILTEYNRTSLGFRRLAAAVTTDFLPRSGLGKIRRSELAESLRNRC